MPRKFTTVTAEWFDWYWRKSTAWKVSKYGLWFYGDGFFRCFVFVLFLFIVFFYFFFWSIANYCENNIFLIKFNKAKGIVAKFRFQYEVNFSELINFYSLWYHLLTQGLFDDFGWIKVNYLKSLNIGNEI